MIYASLNCLQDFQNIVCCALILQHYGFKLFVNFVKTQAYFE